MEIEKKGLTGSQIKTIGLILMVIDHIGHLFGDYVPSWFRLLGRISAPLFIYMAAEGFYYTRSKKTHIKKLYLWSLITLVGNTLLERTLPIEGNAIYLTNNIFLTFAVSFSIIYMIEDIMKNKASFKNIISLVLLGLMTLIVEGSYVFVGLIIMFYFYRDKKALKYGIYIVVSLLLGFASLKSNNWELNSLLVDNQWFMVFSIIPIALYNGKKGRSSRRNFFYIFYPTHMWILYIIKFILEK